MSEHNSIKDNSYPADKHINKTDVVIEVSEENAEKSPFSAYHDEYNPNGLFPPTEEQEQTLRKVPGHPPLHCYLICLIEFAERGSYYGVSGILTNFIQRPLPTGSTTGAPVSRDSSENAGALGLGLQVASAVTLLLTFLAYVAPLIGGYAADSKLGRLKAIWIGVILGAIAHVILIIAAIPTVIIGGKALAPTIISIIVLALGTGFIKPNLLPLLLDQYEDPDLVKVLKSGEKVIVDRKTTLQSISMQFYWCINIGAFLQLATSYCERDIGFWLGYLIPGILYMIMPIVLLFLNNKMKVAPSQGSILDEVFKVIGVAYKGGWVNRLKNGEFWEYAKPSNMIQRGQETFRKKPVTWSDEFVEDVKKTFKACNMFFGYYIIYNICDSGISSSIETSQAGSMSTKGVPNDLFNNFNPLTIIVLIPILDYGIYPMLRKKNIKFSTVHRISLGFFLAGLSQISGAIIQWKIYETSPCRYEASTCDEPSPITAWVEVVVYILSAASECFAMTTGYEVAYSRSPEYLKGLVMALFLFTTALSAALGEALTSVLVDPKLVYAFAIPGAIGCISAFVFAYQYRNLDKEMEQEELERALKQAQKEGAIIFKDEKMIC
ncbi:hypothetical protein DASC09_050660 [Saccharomycopsis crataegensis]|uniref:Peptide transporter PTR2 n=1 Tax=Saccharomycopsis crataegensis TaxID=43959 RepID=A0AAV5QT50_9ASCO|nr:hypothetical protein DASC09_050660 [Saccharomycopsis crataegensis]